MNNPIDILNPMGINTKKKPVHLVKPIGIDRDIPINNGIRFIKICFIIPFFIIYYTVPFYIFHGNGYRRKKHQPYFISIYSLGHYANWVSPFGLFGKPARGEGGVKYGYAAY